MGGSMHLSLGSMLANLSLVAAVLVNMQPKYKKYQMDLSNYNLKTPDLDKSPKIVNTFKQQIWTYISKND